MTQTVAVFVDAYRSLNAKRLFWVVLVFSGLVVGAFALVGINKDGLKIAIWQFDNRFFNTRLIAPAEFYKLIFVNIGIGLWLSWIASILALISTAGIFPDLITSGSIDLLCSKPIGRLRLFVTQYAAGLLFVTLQVTIFCVASFLILGLRGGEWKPGLFVAVPVMVCFFSYLFSVCVFFGVLTRSTLVALLLTLLFWFGVYLLSAGEQALLMFRTMEEEKVAWVDMQQPPVRPAPENNAPVPVNDGSDDAPRKKGRVLRALRVALVKGLTEKGDPQQGSNDKSDVAATDTDEPDGFSTLAFAHEIVYGIKTVLPKTGETISLLERELISRAELSRHPGARGPGGRSEKQVRVAEKLQTTLRSRSIAWIVGTSLIFELVVLAAAAWVFCRRDY